MTKQVKEFFKSIDGIIHTTLNPRGVGVARIHLIPPRKLTPRISWVVIINGLHIIPINTSWAILLTLFIRELNLHGHSNMSDDEMNEILKATVAATEKVFPKTSSKVLLSDLGDIIETITDLAKGVTPPIEIGHMTLSQYAKYMRSPHRMDLLISPMMEKNHWNCNQKCLHCYAGVQPLASTTSLSTSQWKEVINRCKSAYIPQITFTGGEPTMREDLVELVGYASWFVTRLNTNGIKLTSKLCAELYEASLDSVQVTLYSSNPEIHNTLVGGNHFDDTVDGIKNALANQLNLSINTPLCTKNQDYLSTLKFVKELGVEFVSCSGLILTGNASHQTDSQLTENELETVLEKACAFTKSNQMELSFTSPGWVSEEKLTSLGLTIPSCGACLSNMAIAPNGDVVPCQSWLSDEALGNMLKMPWNLIWNGKRCKAIRSQSKQLKDQCPLSKNLRREHLS
ncbi:MAG: radical SAM protein [Bacilli bacterium]|nr:radical SAM protein [Bacilli bacterium]